MEPSIPPDARIAPQIETRRLHPGIDVRQPHLARIDRMHSGSLPSAVLRSYPLVLFRSSILVLIHFLWTSLAQEPPPNDNRASALDLSGGLVTSSGFFDHATAELDEPLFTPSHSRTRGQSLWWKWTSPKDGLVVLSVPAANFWPVFLVLESPTNFVELHFHQPRESLPPFRTVGEVLGFSSSHRHSFRAAANTTYLVGLDAMDGDGTIDPLNPEPPRRIQGSLQWQLNFLPPSANDDFANAVSLPGPSAILSGHLAGETKQIDEPLAGGGLGRTAWWTWVAPLSGTYTVINHQTNAPAIVNFWRGDHPAGLALRQSSGARWVSDRCGEQWHPKAEFQFSARAGESFKIQVDALEETYAGPFRYELLHTASPPVNDDFSAATTLPGTALSITNHTLGATLEPSEPPHLPNGGGSLWYVWTAQSTGSIVISTNDPVVFAPPTVTNFPSIFDDPTGTIGVIITHPDLSCYWREADPEVFEPGFAIYTGDTLQNLHLESSGISPVARVQAGRTYRISVASRRGIPGGFKMSLAFNPLPPNDDFRNAIPLSGGHLKATSYFTGAGRETGEPNHAGSPAESSLWWRWKAPATALASISASPAVRIAVYQGGDLHRLSPVPLSATSAPATFRFAASRGEIYHIALDGGTNRAPVELNLGLQAASLHITRPMRFPSGHSYWFFAREPAGTTVRMELSGNLKEWRAFSTNVLPADVTMIYVPLGAAEDKLFFRVLPLPQ
jgi:hypothetical protein